MKTYVSDVRAFGVVVLMIALVLGGRARVAPGFTPQAIQLAVDFAPALGVADLLPDSRRVDTRVRLRLTNPEPAIDMLVMFQQCSYEPVGEGLVVDDLEGILSGTPSGPSGDPVPFRSESGWQACIRSKSKVGGLFLLRRGEEIQVRVDIDFRTAGNHHVKLVADVYALTGAPPTSRTPLALHLSQLLRSAVRAAQQPVSLFYEVTGSGATASYALKTYADLYFANDPGPEENEGIVTQAYSDRIDPVRLDEYLRVRPTVPADLGYDPRHADLDLITTMTTDPVDAMCECIDPATGALCESGGGGATGSSTGGGAASFVIKGRWSVKWTDHVLHPAWGMRVVAWWNNDGTWTQLGNTIVSSDGSYFFVASHPDYTGQNLRVQLRAQNPWFGVMKENESIYRWVSVDRFNISSPHDEGHRWVNADTTSANGVGELYFGGYQLYSELYNRAIINPQRASMVKLFYPNTFHECSPDNIWSCANISGNLWLIAAHGTDPTYYVIQHELGHQMNYEFWGNKFPEDSGGDHMLRNCYTRGLALLEGYANFVPFWAQETDRFADATVDLDWFSIESPGVGIGYCLPGKQNEVWVAATLWDLHDKRSDGSDTIWFTKHGAVHKIYLKNPVPNDGDPYGMDDLRVPYRNQANAEHQSIVDGIFADNDTD